MLITRTGPGGASSSAVANRRRTAASRLLNPDSGSSYASCHAIQALATPVPSLRRRSGQSSPRRAGDTARVCRGAPADGLTGTVARRLIPMTACPDPPAWLHELPLAPGPPWVTMGLRAVDPAEWLVVDDDYAD